MKTKTKLTLLSSITLIAGAVLLGNSVDNLEVAHALASFEFILGGVFMGLMMSE